MKCTNWGVNNHTELYVNEISSIVLGLISKNCEADFDREADGNVTEWWQANAFAIARNSLLHGMDLQSTRQGQPERWLRREISRVSWYIYQPPENEENNAITTSQKIFISHSLNKDMTWGFRCWFKVVSHHGFLVILIVVAQTAKQYHDVWR